MSYETFYYNLQQGEIARPLIEPDEEQELIALRQEQRALAQPPPQPLARPGQPSAAIPAVQNGQAR